MQTTWPLRRSRSFKVTDFGANRKPICDFLSVINMYWSPNFLAVVFKKQDISQQVVTRMQDLASQSTRDDARS